MPAAVTWAPLRGRNDSNLLHLGFAMRYSDAEEGFRYRTEPEFNQAPLYVDTGFGTETGVLPANSLLTWTAEASWRRGPLWLASEYSRSDVDSPRAGKSLVRWLLAGGLVDTHGAKCALTAQKAEHLEACQFLARFTRTARAPGSSARAGRLSTWRTVWFAAAKWTWPHWG